MRAPRVRFGGEPLVRPVPDLVVPADFPAYRWGCVPTGLATRRQLAALGLRPGGADPVARVVWARGRREAALYVVHRAVAKRPLTPARVTALAAAMRARRTCRACGTDAGYCLPRSWTGCITCRPTTPWTAPTTPALGGTHR